jgi:hypothetical protein
MRAVIFITDIARRPVSGTPSDERVSETTIVLPAA